MPDNLGIPVRCLNCGIRWRRITPYSNPGGTVMAVDVQLVCPACLSNDWKRLPEPTLKEDADDRDSGDCGGESVSADDYLYVRRVGKKWAVTRESMSADKPRRVTAKDIRYDIWADAYRAAQEQAGQGHYPEYGIICDPILEDTMADILTLELRGQR